VSKDLAVRTSEVDLNFLLLMHGVSDSSYLLCDPNLWNILQTVTPGVLEILTGGTI